MSEHQSGSDRPAPSVAVFHRSRKSRRGKRRDGLREKNGRLQREREEVIPKALATRRMMALELTGAERDTRAAYPLGVCRARSLILECEHKAGFEYEAQHRRQVERARTPPSCIGNLQPAEGTISDPVGECPHGRPEKCDCPACREKRSQFRYERAREALKRAGSRSFRLVINVAVHHHWPRFLDTERRRSSAAWLADARDLAALRKGLEALRRSMDLDPADGDDFAAVLQSLEEKLNPTWTPGRIVDRPAEWHQPTDDQIAWALLHDSVARLTTRREQRMRRAGTIAEGS
jgi:hypothetical protein